MTLAEAKELFGLKNVGSTAVIINAYKGSDTQLIIPSLIGKRRVSALADEAFCCWRQPPSGFTETSYLARIGAVETIELPLGMETVGSNAFVGMESLKKITIPSTVTAIGQNAFSECLNLEEVLIDNPSIAIGEEAFDCCIKLKKVLIGGREQAIYTADGTQLLYCPRDVREFDVKAGTTVIDNALYCCDKLEILRLPASFEYEFSYYSGYFASAKSLRYVVVDKDNRKYETHDGALYLKEGHKLLWAPEPVDA